MVLSTHKQSKQKTTIKAKIKKNTTQNTKLLSLRERSSHFSLKMSSSEKKKGGGRKLLRRGGWPEGRRVGIFLLLFF